MPKIQYVSKAFGAPAMARIDAANAIIAEYQAKGFVLTVRQLYYQFVARDLIANKEAEYKAIIRLVNDARLAGLIDWDAIEDRTRNLSRLPYWSSPSDIVYSAAYSYAVNKWATQPYYVEVWIEKEALAGVFSRVCNELSVPFFCCRGYTSQSEMWTAGRRLAAHAQAGKKPLVLHFGDHDPSGMDMSRDITDRLALFAGSAVRLHRLALNMAQVDQYSPPPNPAKTTDSRFEAYLTAYGDESWELDALDPTVLSTLVRDEVLRVRDETAWGAALAREERGREELKEVSGRWSDVQDYLRGGA